MAITTQICVRLQLHSRCPQIRQLQQVRTFSENHLSADNQLSTFSGKQLFARQVVTTPVLEGVEDFEISRLRLRDVEYDRRGTRPDTPPPPVRDGSTPAIARWCLQFLAGNGSADNRQRTFASRVPLSSLLVVKMPPAAENRQLCEQLVICDDLFLLVAENSFFAGNGCTDT